MKRAAIQLLPAFVFAVIILLIFSGCGSKQPGYSLRIIEPPASNGSAQSNLTTNLAGDVYLSWIEPGNEREHALKYAVLKSGSNRWGPAQTLIEDDNWFVNWADFPSLISLNDDVIVAHWLRKVPGGTYAYHVNMAFFNEDSGGSLSDPIRPHLDESATEHGFVSMTPISNDLVLAMWLDGRNMIDGHHGQMTLRSAEVSRSGEIYNKREIDDRVCECCQTSAVRIGESVILAYRDRSDEEIRDISLSRYYNGMWSEPITVHEDHWKFMGCPVNGPALAANKDHGGVTWFTGIGDEAKVYYAGINEQLDNISQPIRIDDGYPLGRVDAVMQEDGTAWVSWVERVDDGAENRIRRISANGNVSNSFTLHRINPERQSGFPRMALSDNRLVVTWTAVDEGNYVNTGIVEVE